MTLTWPWIVMLMFFPFMAFLLIGKHIWDRIYDKKWTDVITINIIDGVMSYQHWVGHWETYPYHIHRLNVCKHPDLKLTDEELIPYIKISPRILSIMTNPTQQAIHLHQMLWEI